MSRWWRAYDEALDDPKLQKLGLETIGAWFNLLCMASKNDGLIKIPHVPFALRLSKARAAVIIMRLATAGLLDRDGDGYRPHNWEKRQYKKNEKGDLPEDADHKGRYIYLITAITGGAVKIGISKNPWARVVELQTSHPEKLSIVATFKTKEVSEAFLHEILASYRRQGEWFDLPKPVFEVIEAAAVAKMDYAALLILLRSELRQTTTETLRSDYVAAPRAEQIQNTDTEKKEDCRESVPTRYPEDFENGFWKPYPRTPVMSKKEALTAWKRLAPEDREKAVAAVNPYLAFLRSKPDHPAVHACRFLSQRRFDGFAAAPLEAEQRKIIRPRHGQILGPEFGEKAAGKIFVLAETPEWDAWCSYARSIGKPAPPRYFHEGWAFTTLWPPGYKPQTEAAE